jgi:thiamine pyrophosphate-dependent acetolactate synthase large subunit-like protein
LPTVANALSRCLHSAGVRRVFGRAIPGVSNVAVLDDSVATLLADAAGHLGPAPGVAFLTDRRLRVSSRPGGRAVPVAITDPVDLVDAVVHACAVAAGPVPAVAELMLEVDLDASVDLRAAPLTTTGVTDAPTSPGRPGPRPEHAPTPASGTSLAALAGPGVIRTGHLDGVRAFAAAAGLGVANTWGAKGMFAWDSPHHLGTCGLQADDFALLGFGEVDLLVVTGLDPDEAPEARWALAPHAVVSPEHLAALARRWDGVSVAGPANHLYPQLASVVRRLSPSADVPLSPARAVADLRAALPPGGMIAADPGLAGLWMARTFPTTDARSIGVPATVAPGYAAAAALAARLDGRPAIAVTTAPVDTITAQVLELAAVLGVGFPLELWARDGPLPSADKHLDDVRAALGDERVTRLTVPVDASQTDELVAVAGEVVAWGGLSLSAGT